MSNLTVDRPRRRRFRWNRQDIPGVAMAAPGVIGLLLFVAAPFLVAVFLSFYNAQLNSPRSPNFIGITQYTRLFADTQFWRALGNNLTFAAVVIPVQTAIALGPRDADQSAPPRDIDLPRAVLLARHLPHGPRGGHLATDPQPQRERTAELARPLPHFRSCGSPRLARQFGDGHALHHLAVDLARRGIPDDHPAWRACRRSRKSATRPRNWTAPIAGNNSSTSRCRGCATR